MVTSCKTLAREFPVRFWSGTFAAVLLGLMLSSMIWQYRLAIMPKFERITSLELLNRANTNAYWFMAEYSSEPDPPCYRDNTYLLYRDDTEDGSRLYYVLAGYPNGHGVVNIREHYKLMFFLPIGFPAGDWNFTMRTHYKCPPFDLVSLHRSSQPVKITVPPWDAGKAATSSPMQHSMPKSVFRFTALEDLP